MLPADLPPPATAMAPVAGVRLPDGRLIFVDGVPADLPSGATVRALLDGQDLTGMVSIPPSLLVWRDPAAHCAVFAEIISPPVPLVVSTPKPPMALFLAEDTAPDEATQAAMLQLAGEDLHRLDRE